MSIGLKNIGLGHTNMPSDMEKSSYVHAFSSFARFICVSLLFIILLSSVCECAIYVCADVNHGQFHNHYSKTI